MSSINAETLQNTIVVPAAAPAQSDEGGAEGDGGRTGLVAHERKSAVGVRQGDRVQILSGVQEARQVITPAASAWKTKPRSRSRSPKPRKRTKTTTAAERRARQEDDKKDG